MSVEIERVVSVRVTALRTDMGISQAELARRSELSPAAISLIEKGERDITLSTAKKLAETLGVGIDYIAGTAIYPDTEMTLRVELAKLRQRMYEISDIAKAH